LATQQLSDLDFNSVARIINLPDGTLPQHPATVAQLNATVEGLSWKDSAKAASTANINLAAPGATIDGVAMAANNRFLAKDQTAAAQNGIYVWNGAAAPATRSLDANSTSDLENAVITIDSGTSAGSSFRQTALNFALDTDPVNWVTFGTSAPAASETTAGVAELATQAETNTGTDDARIITPLKLANWSGRSRKFTGTVGDGTATQFDLTHNFGTRDVTVTVYRNGTPWDNIGCDVSRPDANTVRLNFASAPTASQFSVVVAA
jgi:hypothetical protein